MSESHKTVIVTESPFKWREDAYDFSVVADGVNIDGAAFALGIISSLVDDEGECDIVTCGCGVGGCAGFFDEKFHKTPNQIIWEMRYRGVCYELVFDRSEYEREALKVLKDMVEKNVGWNDFSFDLYDSREEFVREVKRAEEICGA